MDIKSLVDSLRFKNKAQILEDASILPGILPAEINVADVLKYGSLSPDPDQALSTFVKFCETGGLRDGITFNLREFLWVIGASEYLGRILLRFPAVSRLFSDKGWYRIRKERDLFLEELQKESESSRNFNELMSALRQYRAREYFRIGVRDLLRAESITDTVTELSALAESALEVSLKYSRIILCDEFGIRAPESLLDRFVIIGFGKLGGRELNFLSDIDIMYLYSGEGGASALPGGISHDEFFARLAESITRVIAEVTDEGFVFRTDLRLRPDGISGPIALSLPSALDYYGSWGQTWERAALIKARAVAGDLVLGEQFIRGVEPFVYRRYLDYTTLEELRAMKQRMEMGMKRKAPLWNVKTGAGGIRSVEFFVQTMQLINGGKFKKIRQRNTISAIDCLAEEGLIGYKDASLLKEAYLFLRDLEHKIQISDGRRTQEMPEGEELVHLARRMGFEGNDRDALGAFIAELDRHRECVKEMFAGLFYKEERIVMSDIPGSLSTILSEEAGSDEIKDNLRRLGFENIDTAFQNIMRLKQGPTGRIVSTRAKRIFEKLFPIMLQESIQSPSPDRALFYLTEFLNSVGGKIVPYYQLAENPETLKFLVALFAGSEFLSKFLISHPELIDYLILKTYAAPFKSSEEMRLELRRSLHGAKDYEEKMNLLRSFRNSEILRIATNDLYGGLELQEVTGQLTSFAEVLLDECLCIAMDSLKEKFGEPEDASMAILGLGKLGGRELGYNSDLDIIFLHSNDGNTRGGRKSITNREFFTYAAQRVISLLSTYTSEGYLFKVDTRLRPSGNAGAMVSSIDAFRSYHRDSAWLWERQALVKARFVAGEPGVGRTADNLVNEIVYSRGLNHADKKEMLKMRDRIQSELFRARAGVWNIKYERGGLVDLEFLVQALQLESGLLEEGVRHQNTAKAIEGLANYGILDKGDARLLLGGYTFLLRLENRLRLLYDYSHDNLPVNRTELRMLARSLGFHESEQADVGDKLLEEFFYWTKEIKKLYNNYFGIVI